MFERFWGSGRLSCALHTFAPAAVLTSFALLACASPAFASSIHISAGSFGASGSTPSNPDPLGSPGSVAVDNSSGASAHDLYVTDPASFRIEKFDAEGHLLLMFGKQVNKTKTTEGAGEAQENVCVLSSGDECKSGVQGTAGKGQLSAPTFMAVDSSTGSSSGDVYVADTATDVVYKFSPSGAFISENNGEGAGEGHFTGLDGVAVDTSGNVSILDQHGPQIFRFDQAGTFIPGPFPTGGAKPEGLAIDGTGASYLVEGLEAVEKVDLSGKKVGRVLPAPFENGPPATGLTVDQLTNDLYVDTGLEVEHVAPSCAPTETHLCQIADTFGVPALVEGKGLGVDPVKNTVYAADSSTGTVQRFAVGLEATTGGSSGVGAAGATVEATVNPEGSAVTECLFEYGTTEEYGQSVPCEGAVGGGTSPVAVNAKLTGLKGGTTYHYRIFARNGNGAVAGEDAEFPTLTTPTIDSAEAIEVTASSAKLTAKINPHGIATKYRFEYGTSTAYGTSVPIPDQDIGSGTTPVTVSQTIEGLSPDTTYHFRVVLNNTIAGEDHTFAFLSEEGSKGCSNEGLRSGLSAKLPDCRGYEMVTPPNKNAALIGALFPRPTQPQISSDGTRLSVPSIQCFADSPGCIATREAAGQIYEFTREAEGWRPTPLAPPASTFITSSWWSFGAEAGTYLLSAPTGPQGQDDYYMRHADGSLEEIGPFSEAEEDSNAHSAALVSSTNPTSIVFEATRPLWPSFDQGESKAISLYEYVGAGHSTPQLVGVSGGAGSTDLISACGTSIALSQASAGFYGSLSTDGRIALFTAERCPAGGTGTNAGKAVPAAELYERIDGARTVQISKATPSYCTTSDCQHSTPGDAVLEGASNDTSRVLFTSTQQLSDEASEDRHGGDSALHCANTSPSAPGCNLYLSECPAHCEDPAQRKLIDVSAGAQSSGGPKVQG
ncbi:MAG TPA: 6-bladed beta-propeller, partial [Solirubrobacteraceae bacterium]|nr:6-bladed beta-propeller [Solirubrobacteraceae bacterium]